MNEKMPQGCSISFTPLWKTLIDRRMTRGQLCDAAHLARATVTKMGKNEPVSLTVLARICATLRVPVEQVLEIRIDCGHSSDGSG